MKQITLYCNKSEKILPTFSDNSIDVLISDIPYGVNINPKWDHHLPSEEIWNECYRILKPGSHCLLFGQPSMTMNLMKVMANTDFDFRDIWIWQYQGTHTKGTYIEEDGKLFRSRIRNIFNLIYVFRKPLEGLEEENWVKYRTNLLNIDDNREEYEGNHVSILEKFKKTGKKHYQSEESANVHKEMKPKGWVPDERGREPVNIKYIPRVTKEERTIRGRVENDHPTVKPIELMKWLVSLTTTHPEQIVLDPFCGSGSTGCACKLLNRQFIGIDCEPEYIAISKLRIQHVEEFYMEKKVWVEKEIDRGYTCKSLF